MKKMMMLVSVVLMFIVALNGKLTSATYAGSSSGSNYGGSVGGGSAGSGKYVGSYASDTLKNAYNSQDGYNFNFGYKLEDPYYNNYQSRYESGSADPKGQITGSYTVLDPDGNTRTVDYVADWVNGFRATIRDKNGVTQHGYNTDGGDGSYDAGSSGTGGAYGGAVGAQGGASGKY